MTAPPSGPAVVPDGVGGDGPRRRQLAGGDGSFPEGPAVVLALLDDVDLLAVALPDVTQVQLAGERVEAEPPRVAKPHRPELGADLGGIDRETVEAGGADERVVGGHAIAAGLHRRVGVGGQAAGLGVHIDAHQRREEIAGDVLGVAGGVVGVALVTQRRIQVPVGAEVQIAALMVAELVALLDQHLLGQRVGEVRVARADLEARQPLVAERTDAGRVADVEEAVAGVVRMKRQAQQAFLAGGGHPGRDVEEGAAAGAAQVRQHLDPPAFLDHEQAVGLAGRRGESDRRDEADAGEGGLQLVAAGLGPGRCHRRQQGDDSQ